MSAPSAPAAAGRHRRAPAVWGWYLVASAAASAGFFLLPAGGLAQGSLFAVIGAAVPAAIVVGLRVHRPQHRRVWRLLLAGQAVSAVANLVYYPFTVAAGVTLPYPSAADALYLTAYGLLIAGLAVLVRERSRGGDRAGLLDAGIVTTGVGVLSLIYLVHPYLVASELTPLARAVSLAYPLVDVLLLAVAVRVLLSPGARRPVHWLLGLALLGQLAADTAYALTVLDGSFTLGSPVFAGWLLSWTFFGAAALHPSMPTLAQPTAEREPAGAGWRLALLGLAALIPPVVLVVQSARGQLANVPLIAATSVVLFVLVLARVGGLMADVSRYRRVERLKDEFVSVVSHELRTPLTSIRGALGLVAGGVTGPLSDKSQRMLDIAVANTDRLVRLINDILDIERMESGKLTLDRQACSASDLAAQAVGEMRAMADQARVGLSVAARDDRVLVDRDRIIQTLTNLLSNAIKFSPQGSTVWLTAEPDGDQMRFVVRDEGRGIPADKLEAIFGRFQQVDSSDARQKGGSGLGLAICRSIVQQHGGRIWVQSTIGQGSTFTFTLPSAAGPVPTDGPSGNGAGPLVLVCDDDASVLEVMRATLEERGYRVLTAASGQAALEHAARYHPAAILLDVLMPGTSGLDIAAALKQHPETSDIPIVILSVLSPQEADAAPTQVADWLRKPATEASLFRALERALAGQREGLRVLVVEDDPDLARVLTAIFERHGLETHQAQTASEAIRLSQQLQPQLLVLDLVLAEGDGYAVVDWLRQHDRLRELPLIVYTARDLDRADRSRLRLGETKFFTKGRISPEEFERRVTDLIGQIAHPPASDRARAGTSVRGA